MMNRPHEEPEVTADFTSQIVGKLKSPIATGSFGTVYRCTIESSIGETEVAAKVFTIDPKRTMDKLANTIHRELKVWLKLKHSTIVPLLGTARIGEPPLLALVSEWMPFGKLSDYLDKQATIITPAARIKLVKGIAEGLVYLHSENVIHGDLHPGNVLVDDSGNPRLTDFGLATVAEDKELQWTTSTVTRNFDARWHAPEVIGIDSDVDPERPTFKSDMYSFGSVMFFVVSGDVPWKEKKRSNQICIALSQKTTPTRPDNIVGYHWDLIQQCWSWTPEARPEATIVLQAIGNHREGTSTSYDAWSTVTLPLKCQAGAKRQNIVADFRAGIPTIIILFGDARSGKRLVVYLLFFFF